MTDEEKAKFYEETEALRPLVTNADIEAQPPLRLTLPFFQEQTELNRLRYALALCWVVIERAAYPGQMTHLHPVAMLTFVKRIVAACVAREEAEQPGSITTLAKMLSTIVDDRLPSLDASEQTPSSDSAHGKSPA